MDGGVKCMGGVSGVCGDVRLVVYEGWMVVSGGGV